MSKRNHGDKQRPAGVKRQKSVKKSEAKGMDFNAMDSWSWDEIPLPEGMRISDDLGGFLCLEEIEGIDVAYVGDEQKGLTVKFKRVGQRPKRATRKAEPDEPLSVEESKKYFHLDGFSEEGVAGYAAEQEANVEPQENAVRENGWIVRGNSDTKAEEKQTCEVDEEIDEDFDVSSWEKFDLSPKILRALKRLRFSSPTAIQSEALRPALAGRDVAGSAATGSGKTLAFGIPMIQQIASAEEGKRSVDAGAMGLVLAPTRELAMQVQNHLRALAKDVTKAKIAAVVGGMSVQKQHRILQKKPDIVVATPGRLWELCSENEAYLAYFRKIRFLVIDEADRMLQSGHFRELTYLLDALSRKRILNAVGTDGKQPKARQTFVFSATLARGLESGLNDRKNKKDGPKAKRRREESEEKESGEASLSQLMKRIGFEDEYPVVVDVTQFSNGLAEQLKEARINCLKEQKDIILYYFLTQNPGRTLVFVNSIGTIRQLTPMLKLLGVPAYPLHAQMPQRQRLKNLDRFRMQKECVLVASDVAARGLDIPLVDHVVHYHVPRTTETYIHRSGRTARADNEGISVLLVSPEEVSAYRKLCDGLRRGKAGIPQFPVDMNIVAKLKKRVIMSKKIEEAEHQRRKLANEKEWMRKAAKAMDLEIDDNL